MLKQREKGYIEEILGGGGVERPRKTILEEMEQNLRVIGFRVWRRKTQGRNKWIAILKQDLAQYGL